MNLDELKAKVSKAARTELKMRQHGDRSKYMPHQGARECERRRNQRGN